MNRTTFESVWIEEFEIQEPEMMYDKSCTIWEIKEDFFQNLRRTCKEAIKALEALL